jgi:hypothetical protein
VVVIESWKEGERREGHSHETDADHCHEFRVSTRRSASGKHGNRKMAIGRASQKVEVCVCMPGETAEEDASKTHRPLRQEAHNLERKLVAISPLSS